MANESKKRSLAEVIHENFNIGPIQFRAVRNKRMAEQYPDAISLYPVDREELIKAGVDEERMLCNVASFNPKEGVKYLCMVCCREGAKIAELIPLGYRQLAGHEWLDGIYPCTTDLTFVKNGNGRWSARHPLTGQYVFPHRDFKMPEPGTDGKIVIPAGTVEIKPTMTRTFLFISEPGSLAKVPVHEMELYEDYIKVDYSYAEQFQLFGKALYTAEEAMGNPFIGVTEFGQKGDNFTLNDLEQYAKKRADEFDRWANRELLPILHPDFISGNTPAKTQEKIREAAEETRNEIMRLTAWYKGWVAHVVADVRRRRSAGFKTFKLTMPEVVYEAGKARSKRPGRLMDKKRAELTRMLFPNIRRSEEPVKVKPKAEAETSAKPATPEPSQTEKFAKRRPAATQPKLAPKKRVRTTVETHVESPTRTAYVVGDDVPMNGLAEALKNAGLVAEETTDPPPAEKPAVKVKTKDNSKGKSEDKVKTKGKPKTTQKPRATKKSAK